MLKLALATVWKSPTSPRQEDIPLTGCPVPIQCQRMGKTPLEKKLQGLDGRWIAGGLVAGHFLFFLLVHTTTHLAYPRLWYLTGIQAMPAPFGDLGAIADGSEVYRTTGSTAGAPGALFNYPHCWLYAGYLGLNKSTLPIFGMAIAVCFYAATLFVLGKLTWFEGCLATLVLLSPSVLLGVERGNIDLVIFVLLALAVYFYRSPPVSVLIIVAASLLKIFPAFGLLAPLARPWRKSLPWIGLAAGFLLTYFVLDLRELRWISSATPHSSRLSFGACAIFIGLFSPTSHEMKPALFIMADLFLTIVVLLAIWQRPRLTTVAHRPAWEREEFAFKLGAGLYLGIFALGTNWDYRMAMLIFCLPLLFRYRQLDSALRIWANTALVLMLVYMNWFRFSQETELRELVVEQALSWGLLVCLTGILATQWLPPRGSVPLRSAVQS